jgi:hypothetical protein
MSAASAHRCRPGIDISWRSPDSNGSTMAEDQGF